MIIRIIAENEQSALSFACCCVPELFRLQGKSPTAAVVYDGAYCPLLPDWIRYSGTIHEWNFDNAAIKLAALKELGCNLLILSSGFWNWDCADVNDALNAFESAIHENNLMVVECGKYTTDLKYFGYQEEITEENLSFLLELMLMSNESSALVLPWNCTSSFILEPAWEQMNPGNKAVRAMVGLPDDSLKRHPCNGSFPYLKIHF